VFIVWFSTFVFRADNFLPLFLTRNNVATWRANLLQNFSNEVTRTRRRMVDGDEKQIFIP